MAKQRALVPGAAPLRNRPGEGVGTVDVSVKTFVSPDGRSVANLGINLGQAPVPDRRYSAEVCAVGYLPARDTVKVLFGQEHLDGKGGLLTAVALNMSPRSIVQFLESLDANVDASLTQLTNDERVEKQSLVSLSSAKPEQLVTLAANLTLVAAAGTDACLDFYQASPFAVRTAMQSNKVALDAVVRIDLHIGLLLAFIAELRSIRAQFPNIKIWSPG
jgi:hypothetical protein